MSLGLSDDWDDGTVNHKASSEWNAGVSPCAFRVGDPVRVCGTHQNGKVGTVDQVLGWGRFPVLVVLKGEPGKFGFHPTELRKVEPRPATEAELGALERGVPLPDDAMVPVDWKPESAEAASRRATGLGGKRLPG